MAFLFQLRVYRSQKEAGGSTSAAEPKINFNKAKGPTPEQKTINNSGFMDAITLGRSIFEEQEGGASGSFAISSASLISESCGELLLSNPTDSYITDLHGKKLSGAGFDESSARLNNFWVPRSWGNLSLDEKTQEEMRKNAVAPLTEMCVGIFRQFLFDAAGASADSEGLSEDFGQMLLEKFNQPKQWKILPNSINVLEQFLQTASLSQAQKDEIIKNYSGRILSSRLVTVADVSYYTIADARGNPISITNNYLFAGVDGPKNKASVGRVASKITGIDEKNLSPLVFLDPTLEPAELAAQLEVMIKAQKAASTIISSLYTGQSGKALDDAYAYLGVQEWERDKFGAELVEEAGKGLQMLQNPPNEQEYIQNSIETVNSRLLAIRDMFLKPNLSDAELDDARRELMYFMNLISNDRWSTVKEGRAKGYINPEGKSKRNSYQISSKFNYADNSDFVANLIFQKSLDRKGRGFAVITSKEYKTSQKFWVDAKESSANWQGEEGAASATLHVQLERGASLAPINPALYAKNLEDMVKAVNSNDVQISATHLGNNHFAVKISEQYSMQSAGEKTGENKNEEKGEDKKGEFTLTTTSSTYNTPLYFAGEDMEKLLLFVPSTLNENATPIPILSINATSSTSSTIIERPLPSGFYAGGNMGMNFMGDSPQNRGFGDFAPNKDEIGEQGTRKDKSAPFFANFMGEKFANPLIAGNPLPYLSIMENLPEFESIYSDIDLLLEGAGGAQGMNVQLLEALFKNNVSGMFSKFLSYEQNGKFMKMSPDAVVEVTGDGNFKNVLLNYFECAYWRRVYSSASLVDIDRESYGRKWKEAEMNMLISGAKFAGLSAYNCHLWNSFFWNTLDSLTESLQKNGVSGKVGYLFNWLGAENRVELGATFSYHPNFELEGMGLAGSINSFAMLGSFIYSIHWADEVNFRIRANYGATYMAGSRLQKENPQINSALLPVSAAWNALWDAFQNSQSTGTPITAEQRIDLCDALIAQADIFSRALADDKEGQKLCEDLIFWAQDMKGKTWSTTHSLLQLKSAYDALSSHIGKEYSLAKRSDAYLDVFGYNHPTGEREGTHDELIPGGNISWIQQKGEQEMSSWMPLGTMAVEVFGHIPVYKGISADYLLTARPPPSLFFSVIGMTRPDDEMKTSDYVKGLKEGLPMLNTSTPTLDLNLRLSKELREPWFNTRLMGAIEWAFNANHLVTTGISGTLQWVPTENLFGSYSPTTISLKYGFSKPIDGGSDWKYGIFSSARGYEINITQALPNVLNGLVVSASYANQAQPVGYVDINTGEVKRNFGASTSYYKITAALNFDISGSTEKLPPSPAAFNDYSTDPRLNPYLRRSTIGYWKEEEPQERKTLMESTGAPAQTQTIPAEEESTPAQAFPGKESKTQTPVQEETPERKTGRRRRRIPPKQEEVLPETKKAEIKEIPAQPKEKEELPQETIKPEERTPEEKPMQNEPPAQEEIPEKPPQEEKEAKEKEPPQNARRRRRRTPPK